MSEPHSNQSAYPDKPEKPTPDFPLFPHANKTWAKKIRGRLHYFGPWADPQAALARYNEQKEALHAGRKPRPETEALTVKDLVNAFLNHKRARVDNGELSLRTWASYKDAGDQLVKQVGMSRLAVDLGPDDFAALRDKLTSHYGHHRLCMYIQYIRSVFKHGYEADLLEKPMRFGPGYIRPSKKTLRLDKAKHGAKLFSREEIHKLLKAAGPPMKAMILLGINCGFGNADCATLPLSGLDLVGRMIDFTRPKTGIERKCPLWPETVDALKAYLAKRPDPNKDDHAGLVFITKYQ